MSNITHTLAQISKYDKEINNLHRDYFLTTAHSFLNLKGRVTKFKEDLGNAQNPGSYVIGGYRTDEFGNINYERTRYQRKPNHSALTTLPKAIGVANEHIKLNQIFAQEFAAKYNSRESNYTSSLWERTKERITGHKAAICNEELTASEIAFYARNNPNSRTAKVWKDIRSAQELQE